MDIAEIFAGSLVSASAVVAVALYVARESFKKLLDKELATYKHELELSASRRTLAAKAEIEFRERQLGEFYGPIYAILKRGRTVHQLWMDRKLGQIDEQLMKFSVESNEQIVDILIRNIHLIDGAVIPPSFVHYLSHVVIWHSHLAAGLGGVTSSQQDFPEAYYPVEFEQEIFETTERLKRNLAGLYQESGLVPKRE